MSLRKSSSSLVGGSKKLKEKVVQYYEQFCQGDDPSLSSSAFWDEFFLLKPKPAALEQELSKCKAEALPKNVIRLLFINCVRALGDSENYVRVVNAAQTLTSLVDCVVKLTRAEFGYDLLDALTGFEQAEHVMGELLENCSSILMAQHQADNPPPPAAVRRCIIHTLLSLATCTEILSKNRLLEYMCSNTNVVDSLLQLLQQTETRLDYGYECLVLIGLLVNFEKDRPNAVAVRLSLIEDHLTLNGYSQAITTGLSEFNLRHANNSNLENQNWLHSFTSIVVGSLGSMFVQDGDALFKGESMCGAKLSLLIALYEAVHLNRNFTTTLANTKTDVSPSNTLAAGAAPNTASLLPSNLLVTFLEYCSLVMADLKTESSLNIVKLCFIILTCISEDQYANALMCDSNLVFRVHLHRVPMRHRKINQEVAPPAPLITGLLDLLVEFLMTHLTTKRMPHELYGQVVGILHRLLCYQRRSRTRLPMTYSWRPLWTSLFTVLKFLHSNELQLLKKFNIFNLALSIVNILNLFITTGDSFLVSPTCYDELYYELIRWQGTWESVWSCAARYASTQSEFQGVAAKLSFSLANIRSILAHFSPKIDEFLHREGISTPSEEQIIDLVRSNYDSLILKIMDGLDQFERYSELPHYTPFFTSIVRVMVKEARTELSNYDYGSGQAGLIASGGGGSTISASAAAPE